jgi:hypothetical protein
MKLNKTCFIDQDFVLCCLMGVGCYIFAHPVGRVLKYSVRHQRQNTREIIAANKIKNLSYKIFCT